MTKKPLFKVTVTIITITLPLLLALKLLPQATESAVYRMQLARPTLKPISIRPTLSTPSIIPTKASMRLTTSLVPKPTLRPTSAPPVTSTTSAPNNEYIGKINTYRSSSGINPVSINSKLCSFADKRLEEISNDFSHTGFTNFAPEFYKQNSEFRALGENLARDFPNFDAVMSGWDKSPGHKANLLNPNYNTACVSANSRDTVLLLGGVK